MTGVEGCDSLGAGGAVALNSAIGAGTGVVTLDNHSTPGASVTGSGLITAGGLSIYTDAGIGPLNTAVANLEAQTATGGISINNSGNLAIGGVSGLTGVRVTGSGGIQLV